MNTSVAGHVGQSFLTRHFVGEDLYFRSQMHDVLHPIVVGLSAGAVDVGYPTAALSAGTLHRLSRADLVGADQQRWTGKSLKVDGVQGRFVVLMDDGLMPVAMLAIAAKALGEGQPSTLVVASPVSLRGLTQLVGKGVVDRTVTLRKRPPGGDVSRLYGDEWIPEGAADRLVDSTLNMHAQDGHPPRGRPDVLRVVPVHPPVDSQGPRAAETVESGPFLS